MKLYYSKGTCSLAVRIVINEIGITSEYVEVDLKTKKTASGEDYLQINPKGSVPVIMTDAGEILTENAVIQQYLADENKAENLLPLIGNFKRYRVLEWLNYISTELHKGCGPLFSPAVPPELKNDLFRPALKNKLAYVEKNLKNKFLLGDHFTLPDAYLFVILSWTPHLKIDLHDLPNLSRYFAELQHYPAIQKSLKEEGISYETHK